MIGVEIRGSHLGGLLRYLYQPADNHDDPHIVSSWNGQTDRLDPKGEPGEMDFRPLTSQLMAPNDLMRTPQKQPVMHIPLAAAKEGPGGAADRMLTDKEWGEIAQRVVSDLGLGGVNDPAGCRWIAVRHAPEHVHLVVTLARQNGKRADVPWSKLRISNSCEQISKDYGLRVAPSPDATAGRWPTRAEMEKFKRQQEALLKGVGARSGVDPGLVDKDVAEQLSRLGEPTHPAHPRNQLKELVQRTIAKSGSTEAFIANLQEQARRSSGTKDEVVVRVYPAGSGDQVRGYSIGFKHWTAVGRDGLVAPVMYGGSKLDACLSMPRLRAERGWDAEVPGDPATPGSKVQTAESAAGPGSTPADVRPAPSRAPATSLKLNLRRLAEEAASEAGDVDGYFAVLQSRGVVVNRRYSVENPSEVTGYKVGLRAHRNRTGDDLEWVTGSRLDPNGAYTLKALKARWSGPVVEGTAAPATAPQVIAASPASTAEAVATTRETVQVVRAATTVTQKRLAEGRLASTDDVARSVSDLLHGTAAAWEGGSAGPFTRAARAYDRGYRVPQHRQVPRSGPGADLTLAALGLGLAASFKSPAAVERIALMASLKMLLEVVADIRVAQLRNEAAAAARAAAGHLQMGIDEALPGTMRALHREAIARQAEVFGTRLEAAAGSGGQVSEVRAQTPRRGR
ncbi:MAG: hypothetical protein ACT4OM_13355 [Actinomycetota bacterium]